MMESGLARQVDRSVVQEVLLPAQTEKPEADAPQ
jgi:hypothetical protein